MNLVKKLALTLAITSVISLTSCASDKDELVSTVASTSSTGITDMIYIVPESSKENNYISFIGHFDAGVEYSGAGMFRDLSGYKNHKDYRITYKVSQEDYKTISKIVINSRLEVSCLSKDEADQISEIISNSEVVEVEDLKVTNEFLHDEIKEEFRFNEEEYNENLETSNIE